MQPSRLHPQQSILLYSGTTQIGSTKHSVNYPSFSLPVLLCLYQIVVEDKPNQMWHLVEHVCFVFFSCNIEEGNPSWY